MNLVVVAVVVVEAVIRSPLVVADDATGFYVTGANLADVGVVVIASVPGMNLAAASLVEVVAVMCMKLTGVVLEVVAAVISAAAVESKSAENSLLCYWGLDLFVQQ